MFPVLFQFLSFLCHCLLFLSRSQDSGVTVRASSVPAGVCPAGSREQAQSMGLDFLGGALSGVEVELARSETSSLEFSPAGVSKGSGLAELCHITGLPLEATIAVGDSDNDLPILERAGLAVAMGNARERVRQAAGAVVADNDHDGCAEAIRRFLLGDERA